jgi:hypothetical protein
VVDATRPVDDVTGEVAGLIRRLAGSRGRKPSPGVPA